MWRDRPTAVAGAAPCPFEAPCPLEPLLDARFRGNPNLVLRRFDELPARQRQALADFEESEFQAVLVPRDAASDATAKVIGPDTAALFNALCQPGPLPAMAGPGGGIELTRSVAMLVLDGILQIESADGFAGGARAHPLVFGSSSRPAGRGRLSTLSFEALRYAQALPLTDARRLSHRLYAYNRVPIHPRWQKRFGDAARIESALALGPYDHSTARLAVDYALEEHRGWRSWSRAGSDPNRLRYKLYVSPHPDSLAPVFRTAVEVFAGLAVPAFKVGRDLPGLLRPDKIIAYFESYEAIEETARTLAPCLADCRPQGVPFSAELTPDGMLSWGVDPPVEAALIQWRGLESWRLWISNQLSTALLQARQEAPAPVEPWHFALDRLRLHGIDIKTWAPALRQQNEVVF